MPTVPRAHIQQAPWTCSSSSPLKPACLLTCLSLWTKKQWWQEGVGVGAIASLLALFCLESKHRATMMRKRSYSSSWQWWQWENRLTVGRSRWKASCPRSPRKLEKTIRSIKAAVAAAACSQGQSMDLMAVRLLSQQATTTTITQPHTIPFTVPSLFPMLEETWYKRVTEKVAGKFDNASQCDTLVQIKSWTRKENLPCSW